MSKLKKIEKTQFMISVLWALTTVIIKLDQIRNELRYQNLQQKGTWTMSDGEKVYDGTQPIEKAEDIVIPNPPIHTDNFQVEIFARKMKAKLAKKRAEGYDNWRKCPINDLKDGLYQHLSKGDPIDVANYCMFLNARQETTDNPNNITTVTARLNTDIDGYLAGKKSFISAYVDLLLARMAKEKLFGDGEFMLNRHFLQNEIIVLGTFDDEKYFAVIASNFNQNRIAVSYAIKVIDDEVYSSKFLAFDATVVETRPITEAEAVEFRQAMEAVYG